MFFTEGIDDMDDKKLLTGASRRSVLAKTVGLGIAVGLAGIPMLGDPASASAPEAGWRFCAKCFGMILLDGYAYNACPKDGWAHDPQGWIFWLPYNDGYPGTEEDSTHQANWRRCGSCSGLYWNGNPNISTGGICPVRGWAGHDLHDFRNRASHQYVLRHDVGTPPDTQEWRYCDKCSGLFFNGYASKGACPRDGGGHSANCCSFRFAIPVLSR
jgi:hypothetical protein